MEECLKIKQLRCMTLEDGALNPKSLQPGQAPLYEGFMCLIILGLSSK